MFSKRAHNYLCSFLAFIVLSITLIAKVPNPRCRCHETNKTKQTQECPFGKLRQIVSTLITASEVGLVLASVAEYQSDPIEYKIVLQESETSTYKARAPPHSFL